MSKPAEPPPEVRPPRHVLGTTLECTSHSNFTARVHVLSQSPRTVAVDFTNTQIVTLRRHSEHFRAITNRFDFFVPDSSPLIWCLNWQRGLRAERTYGPAFMRYCVAHSPPPFTHYFLGGSEDCLQKLVRVFRELNPAVRIVGARNGYFRPDEENEILAEINRLSPNFIWVGLGTPKQQDWIHRHKGVIRRGVLLAVGFAFDVNAGTKPDAPAWMQGVGLTWLYRLCSEPRRLLPRYLKYNSLFLWYLLWDGIRGRAWRQP
jgi:N-acetylglucosaminyldiphosphoundecaprenol N-acetyl-beta-D-mannosaminyltransferase